jgi:3-oxoacyl-[acyl-carrier-protein] synthase-3
MPKDNAGEAASRPLPDQPLGTVAGNATYRYTNVSVLAISGLEAPIVVTSDEIDERLAPTLRRLRLRPGMLQQIAGVNERRWWPQDVSFADAAATAGAKALAEAGIDPARVGLLINSSVSREHLEPSTAVAVHHNLGLSSSAMNFDVSNACLGFINAMHISATMIDSGQIEYALVVNGEDARRTQEATLARLASPDATIRDFRNEFASLTLGRRGGESRHRRVGRGPHRLGLAGHGLLRHPPGVHDAHQRHHRASRSEPRPSAGHLSPAGQRRAGSPAVDPGPAQ